MHNKHVCLIIVLSSDRFGLGFTHDTFIFAHHMFMHFSCIRSFFSFLFWTYVSLSNRLRYGTQTKKIHSNSEPSSWFRVILLWSSCSFSYSVLWWEGQDGFFWELPEPWRSSKMPSHSVGLLRHCSTRSHSDSGMGVPLWETWEMSGHVHLGVLLQHAQHQYLCTSFCYHIMKYTYRSYSESYIRGTTRS